MCIRDRATVVSTTLTNVEALAAVASKLIGVVVLGVTVPTPEPGIEVAVVLLSTRTLVKGPGVVATPEFIPSRLGSSRVLTAGIDELSTTGGATVLLDQIFPCPSSEV